MEFIRKDELKEKLHNSIEYWKDKDDCTLITLLGVVDDVNNLPTIDSETVIYPSRPKGEWMKEAADNDICCSNCRELFPFYYQEYDYCPHCGSEMLRGEE